MNANDEPLKREEDLRAENDFLKMKIMIEQDAEFLTGNGTGELPPEIENWFLRNIIDFDQQFARRNTIAVFEKIGKPRHFKPVNEIPDEEIDQAWAKLCQYMDEHGVNVSFCSPKVTARELYRFSTEELFYHKTDDIKIPGLVNSFIYDDFFPDHEYDNGVVATEDCIRPIFSKEPFEWMHYFADTIFLNGDPPLTKDDFKNVINRFKDLFDDILLDHISTDSSRVQGDCCIVEGTFLAYTRFENESSEWTGHWLVEFCREEDLGEWLIHNVEIGGISFY